ncbi:MAG: Mo-dependent nitrogenase C-terminal domain-containing protein [Phormidesmis sp.]
MFNLVEPASYAMYPLKGFPLFPFKGLSPIRQWLDRGQIRNAALADLIRRVVPTQCPFERDIYLFGLTVPVPPLCKLNPLYEEVVSLRMRSLCYLADECNKDIRCYC